MTSLTLLASGQSALLLAPASLAGAVATTVTGLMVIAWLWHRRPIRTVLRHDGSGRWSMHWNVRSCHGTLSRSGYCSQWVVVLAIRSEAASCRRGGVHRCIVWRDAVNPRDFSYLQLMMMTSNSTRSAGTDNREGTPA